MAAAMSVVPLQVAGAQSPSTSVLVPSSGATLSGSTYLDASASNATSVEFLLFGGTYGYSAPVVCTATLTYYGWLCAWDTTTVPNGSYALVSEASGMGGSAFSSGVNITVSNPLPSTSILIPSNSATLSGSTYLDASATNATSVEFLLFGGVYGYNAPVLCTATSTAYGWLCDWNSTTVPSGSYALVSEAFNSAGSAFSSRVSITVNNPPSLVDLTGSSFAVTTSPVAGGNGCSFFYVAFDAVYPGSAAVGNVTLHIAGCATTDAYAGSFTITTGVGTLRGSAAGPIITPEGTTLYQIYQITLSVNAATGSFAGMTGNLLFSQSSDTSVASVAVE